MYKRIVFLILALTLIFSVPTLQSTASTGSVSTENTLTKKQFSPSKYELTSTNQTKPTGGTLRVGLPLIVDPWTLNPLIDWYVTAYGSEFIWRNLFGCLLRWNEHGDIVPDLARNWEITDDGLNITFALYGNITWHDGVEFNSSDIKFTYDTIFSNPDVVGFWKNLWPIENKPSVEIVNKTVVTFRFTDNYAPSLNCFAATPVIPWHLYNGTDMLINPYNENPIGSGPFRFVDWVPEANITMEANDAYHRGRPYLDGLTIRWDLLISQLSDLLIDNVIDVVPYCTNITRIQDLEEIPGVSIIARSSPGVGNLCFNHSNPILGDLSVRQAIAHAINKSEICRVCRLGYAEPATGPIYPTLTQWYNPNVTKYEFNQTLANQILNESGYPRDPDTGIRFQQKLNYLYHSKGFGPGTFEMIREYCLNIGVNLTLHVKQTTGELLSGFDIVFMGWGNFPDLGILLYWLYHSYGIYNFWNYSNPQTDQLLEEGLQTLNQTERQNIYYELQEVLAFELPHIYLWCATFLTAFNNDFHGFISEGLVWALSPYSLENVWYEPTLSGEGNCPYWVCYMHNEKRTGYHPWYGELTQIPNSTYSGKDSDPQVVKLRSPKGVYYLDVICKDNGTHKYEVEIVNIALNYKHVQIVKGTLIGRSIIHRIKRYVINISEDGSMTVKEIRIGGRPRDVFILLH